MEIVKRVEDGMDRHDILCTTYQMRNFYRQLGDGFFSVLDVMNYIQHHQVVKWCKPGNHVLDVCCGRGLLLPMLRYQRKDIGSYTGVDIEPKNAIFEHKRVPDGKPIDPDYYPFPVHFVRANVADMSPRLERRFDVIVYTSSIEHMHKDMGQQSLYECRAAAKDGAIMIVTCPNTPEGQDGYDTQYRAHVYEWKRSELVDGLALAGWDILSEYGLLHNKKDLGHELDAVGMGEMFRRVSKFVPSEWLIPVFSPMFPRSAKEIGLVCKAV
jgi:SAM-dependent methyltransferase